MRVARPLEQAAVGDPDDAPVDPTADQPSEPSQADEEVAASPQAEAGEADQDLSSTFWDDTAPRNPPIGKVRPQPTPLIDAANSRRLAACSADGGMIGGWWLSAASIAGTSHVAQGTTRQDDYSFGLLDDGSLVAVVTDGLGSYKETAQVGAGLMARAVVEMAQVLTASGVIEQLLPKAVLNAQELAAERGREMYGLSREQLSCTLVASHIGPERETSFVRVGDAEAFTPAAGNAGFDPVFEGGDHSLVNVVTAACPRARPEDVESVTAAASSRIVLASDGLATDIRNSTALRGILDEGWRNPTSAALMLETLRYRRQGSHDDRTGLVIWRCDPPTGPEPEE